MSAPITEEVSDARLAELIDDSLAYLCHQRDDAAEDVRTALRELQQLRISATASGDEGWRTVESGMPPPDVWVYIYCGKAPRAKDRRQYVACRHEYGHKRRMWMTDMDDEWGVAGSVVTHWKPMQENPK